MPRDTSGKYTLPAGNPVVADTEILASWANTTMPDIGNALTQSLPRDGGIPMLGPLYLARDAVAPKEAVTKQQFDAAILNEGNFIPAGAIQWFAMDFEAAPPTGWLVCDGGSYDRTAYSDLYAAIKTIYGYGTGGEAGNTFNVPDMRGMFLRGLNTSATGVDPGRKIGVVQTDANKAHSHTVTDNGHAHDVEVADHTHDITQTPHSHSAGAAATTVSAGSSEAATVIGPTGSSNANITIDAKKGLTGTAKTEPTGISINNDGGTESRPQNLAMVACIRAYGSYISGQLGSMAYQNANSVSILGGSGDFAYLYCANDPDPVTNPSTGGDYAVLRWIDVDKIGGIKGISSSDTEAIGINNTVPTVPQLVVKTNSGNGLVKLANGFIPQELLNQVPTTYIGTWDASLSTNPPPTAGVTNGDMYQVVVAGDVNLHNSAGVVVLTTCNVGDQIVYVLASPSGNPDGWYYNPVAVPSSLPATAITVTPSGGISATNAQAALQELDVEKAPFASPTFTGVPKAPTPATSSNDTTLATTQYVKSAIANTTFKVADGTYGDIIVSGTGTNWQINAGAVGATETTAEIAKVGVAQNWTKPQRSTPLNANTGAFDVAMANNFSCIPTGNFTIEFSNAASQEGQSGIIRLINNAAFTALSKGANVKCSATMLATISATGEYLLSYLCVGGIVYLTNSGALV